MATNYLPNMIKFVPFNLKSNQEVVLIFNRFIIEVIYQTECNFLIRVHEKPQKVISQNLPKATFVSFPCNHQNKIPTPNPFQKETVGTFRSVFP